MYLEIGLLSSLNRLSEVPCPLLHLEMLILAPTTKIDRADKIIVECIAERIERLQNGSTQELYKEAVQVSSWTAPTERPDRNDNQATQEAANNDNFWSASARVCNNDTMTNIGAYNIQTVHGLYHQPFESLGHPTPPATAQRSHHLPGDICASIKKDAKIVVPVQMRTQLKSSSI